MCLLLLAAPLGNAGICFCVPHERCACNAIGLKHLAGVAPEFIAGGRHPCAEHRTLKLTSILQVLTFGAMLLRSVTIKMGPRYDMGDLCPKEHDGWKFALGGTDFGIWEKTA